MNTREIGTYYEDAVAAYLVGEGVKIIDRNVRCGKIGEIDIIGLETASGVSAEILRDSEDAQTLIFFEVKYRKNHSHGYPAEAVDKKKQSKIRKCAEYYLTYKSEKRFIRFDVIAVEGEEINWYKNAF